MFAILEQTMAEFAASGGPPALDLLYFVKSLHTVTSFAILEQTMVAFALK